MSLVYAAPGVFTVALRVTDDDSDSSEITTAVVTVSKSSPNGPGHPWQNPLNPIDVDDDGEIIPLDALLIINHLNAYGSHALPVPINPPDAPPPYLDVDGDDWVAPIDALQVINHLNGQLDGEGEVYLGQAAATLAPRAVAEQWADMAWALTDDWLDRLSFGGPFFSRLNVLGFWCDRVDRFFFDWPDTSDVRVGLVKCEEML